MLSLSEEQNSLSPKEKAERENIYNPNYKLRYQYREYHLSPSDLLPMRPDAESKVDLKRIHNDYLEPGGNSILR